MGRRIKKRVGATAQLIIGQDDDLIEWLQNLPDGSRNGVIKAALRLFAFDDSSPPEFHQRERNDAALVPIEELYNLRDDYERFARDVMGELDALRHEVAERQANGIPISKPDLVEPADQIDENKVEQRKQKLKKANW